MSSEIYRYNELSIVFHKQYLKLEFSKPITRKLFFIQKVIITYFLKRSNYLRLKIIIRNTNEKKIIHKLKYILL